jgi:hypothetical protein
VSFASLAGARIPHGPVTPDPVLLMHLDGDLVDAMGITVFDGTGYGFESGSSGFGQRAAVTGGAVHVFGVSSQDLSIGTRQFTFEGRCSFATGQAGGMVLSKNYWSSQPPPGVFKHDFTVSVTPTKLTMFWEGNSTTYDANLTTVDGVEFHWAITDDGTSMRFYKDGVLLQTRASASLDATTPPVTPGSGLTLMGQLQGFLGSSPNWSTSFVGRLDELVMWLDYARYTGSTYTVPTAPYAF